MEQRIGRIDRVCSQADRRLSSLDHEPIGDDWLQVYFPYLDDTVEVLQVERVLERMTPPHSCAESLGPTDPGDHDVEYSNKTCRKS